MVGFSGYKKISIPACSVPDCNSWLPGFQRALETMTMSDCCCQHVYQDFAKTPDACALAQQKCPNSVLHLHLQTFETPNYSAYNHLRTLKKGPCTA